MHLHSRHGRHGHHGHSVHLNHGARSADVGSDRHAPENRSGAAFEFAGRGGRGFGRGHGSPGSFGGGADDGYAERRGRRLFAQGDLKLLLLHLLSEQPRHGYELIRVIGEMLGGTYTPSPGTIYPTLSFLEEQDYVRQQGGGEGRKPYEITDTGRALLEENRAVLDGLLARLKLEARALAGNAVPMEVRQAMHTLKHALMLKNSKWQADETARLVAAIHALVEQISGGEG